MSLASIPLSHRRRKTRRDLSTSAKLQKAVNDSVIIPAASRPSVIRAVQLFYCEELAEHLVELYRNMEEDLADFASAYATFITQAPPRHLRQRYRARLEAVAAARPAASGATEILLELESQLLGSVSVLELLADEEVHKLTATFLAERFKHSAMAMSSESLRRAIAALTPPSAGSARVGFSADGVRLFSDRPKKPTSTSPPPATEESTSPAPGT
jgi:hypothetical protein